MRWSDVCFKGFQGLRGGTGKGTIHCLKKPPLGGGFSSSRQMSTLLNRDCRRTRLIFTSVEPPYGITRLCQVDCFKSDFPATVEPHQMTRRPIPNCPLLPTARISPTPALYSYLHVVDLLGMWRDRCTLDRGMLASSLDSNHRPEHRRRAATYEYEANSSTSSRQRDLNIVSGQCRAGQCVRRGSNETGEM